MTADAPKSHKEHGPPMFSTSCLLAAPDPMYFFSTLTFLLFYAPRYRSSTNNPSSCTVASFEFGEPVLLTADIRRRSIEVSPAHMCSPSTCSSLLQGKRSSCLHSPEKQVVGHRMRHVLLDQGPPPSSLTLSKKSGRGFPVLA